MKFTLFPGCVSHQSCPELLRSTKTVLQAIELELVETDKFSCCGAGYLSVAQDDLGIAVNARNFALAGKEEAAIITPCSTCHATMRKAELALEDHSLREEVKQLLKDHELDIDNMSKFYHLVEVLTERKNLAKIANKIIFPLENLLVAPFYGCHLIRPNHIIGDITGPARMDSLINALGATLIHCSTRSQCCGFHVQLENEKGMLMMAAEFLAEARDRDSDLVLTSCPLCQMVFDMYQYKIRKITGGNLQIPVLHLAQLVGLALGTGGKAVGLGRNIVSPKRVLSKEIRRGYRP
ncbi:MAG: CoB--CoM heterodisulfide reductase iron-sulfur subunit B family protein [Candidatus Heimdallarchaeota archaeon]